MANSKGPYQELSSNRLLLSKMKSGDKDSVKYLRSEPAINKFVDRPSARTGEEALKFINKVNNEMETSKLYYWAIRLTESPAMIGSICLWKISKSTRTAEVGYDLGLQFQRQGIMTEALNAVMRFGFEQLELIKIVAYTHQKNAPSIKMLEKNGFKEVIDQVDTDNVNNLIFEINRKEFYESKKRWNSKLYNEKHAFVYQYGEQLVNLLDPKSDEQILDIGCGTGQLTAMINELATSATGMDQSAEMIYTAKEKYPDIDFRVADVTTFRFKERYDAIFSNATLHWVKQADLALKNMKHHLKPGGRLVLEFGARGNVENIISQMRKSLEQNGFPAQASLKCWYFPSVEEYTAKLKDNGFHIEEARGIDRPTELADEQTGIKDWLSMFASQFFEGISPEIAGYLKDEIQEALRPQCLIGGKWIADYKRIRLKAIKKASEL